MAGALIGPFVVGAIVLGVAGVAKLRAPAVTVAAFQALGVPAPGAAVRVLGAGEVALGAWCAVAPTRPAAAAMAAAFAGFACAALALARRRAACGCFGEHDAPASRFGALVSAALAACAALTAAAASPRGLAWAFSHSPLGGAVLLAGALGGTYACLLLYTEAPGAWSAWGAP